jgi:glycosyltransferase involved in cell wall biosynthesis
MDAVARKPMGGTELMVAGLQRYLGDELDRVTIGVNCLPRERDRPIICWLHHDYNQPAVQWLRDASAAALVDAFVFVSHWQRERYQLAFRLPHEKCHVLYNAVEFRGWPDEPRSGRRYAYTSTPFRGLDVLLDAWEMADMSPDAELHVWSSMALYGQQEGPYEALYDRARALPGVRYHGYESNADVRNSLFGMDYLVYPATWEETSCLSVIEGLVAGCRVICPEYGALPETTMRMATTYPWIPDKQAHARKFAGLLQSVPPLETPAQAKFATEVYAWPERAPEWRRLIASLT